GRPSGPPRPARPPCGCGLSGARGRSRAGGRPSRPGTPPPRPGRGISCAGAPPRRRASGARRVRWTRAIEKGSHLGADIGHGGEREVRREAPRVTGVEEAGLQEDDDRAVPLAPDATPCGLQDLVDRRVYVRVLVPALPPELPDVVRLQRLHLEGRRAEREPDDDDRGEQVPRIVDALGEGPALYAHQEAAPPDLKFPERLEDASSPRGPPPLLLHDE